MWVISMWNKIGTANRFVKPISCIGELGNSEALQNYKQICVFKFTVWTNFIAHSIDVEGQEDIVLKFIGETYIVG